MADVLSSWNDGAVKSAIVDFVARITTKESADYVPPADRVATFDNDGTLWCEQPMQVQFLFLVDRVKKLVAKDPPMKERQPFKALLEHDFKTLHTLGMQGLHDLFAATHSGMIQEEFESIVRDWFASATHPKLARPFNKVTFQPQVELLDYLRANGFRTFIVSGGGVDFMRVISEGAYGVAREQVVGSSGKLKVDMQDGRMVLTKLPETNSFDDREAKAQNIGLHIGRRPLLAFGNSDGDLAMLRYTKTGPGPRLALLVHHDDNEREVAYDRDFKLSPLVEALEKAGDYGLTIVSMKHDWKTVFA
jgi:haloacid dehalogenase-like hydrolase